MTSITAFAKTEWPKDTGIEAEAGIVIDADTGAVLFGQNIHNTYPPASITKLLTALVVLENSQLDEVVKYTATALNSVEQGSGNKLSLREGDELTVEDSLYSLLLLSVNQSANALAEHTAGSMSAFVDMMNDKVAELGLTESHFDNPSGLNGDTQYVSAYDMAMIARAAFDNPELLKISSTINYKIGPTQLFPDGQSFRHEHRLLYTTDETSPYYCPEAIAGKTGYLIAAGNTEQRTQSNLRNPEGKTETVFCGWQGTVAVWTEPFSECKYRGA
jgi:D-alanyl-D-alanine carboxypeptidase